MLNPTSRSIFIVIQTGFTMVSSTSVTRSCSTRRQNSASLMLPQVQVPLVCRHNGYIYVYIYIYVCMHVFMYVRMQIQMCIYKYICICICMYVFVCIYIYIHVCTYAILYWILSWPTRIIQEWSMDSSLRVIIDVIALLIVVIKMPFANVNRNQQTIWNNKNSTKQNNIM